MNKKKNLAFKVKSKTDASCDFQFSVLNENV